MSPSDQRVKVAELIDRKLPRFFLLPIPNPRAGHSFKVNRVASRSLPFQITAFLVKFPTGFAQESLQVAGAVRLAPEKEGAFFDRVPDFRHVSPTHLEQPTRTTTAGAHGSVV